MASENPTTAPFTVAEAMQLLDLAQTVEMVERAIADYEEFGCTDSPHHQEHLDMRTSAIRRMWEIQNAR